MQTLAPSLKKYIQKLTDSNNSTSSHDIFKDLKTPLVDPHPEDSNQILLTFVAFGSEDVTGFQVIGGLIDWDFENNSMQRLDATNLWYLTYTRPADIIGSYRIAKNAPSVSVNNLDWEKFRLLCKHDTTNPNCQIYRENPLDFSCDKPEEITSVFRGPKADKDLYLDLPADFSSPNITCHKITSKILNNTRSVWIYRTPGYENAKLPLSIFFDGQAYLSTIPTHYLLPFLIASGKAPPQVAVFIDSLDVETRNQELSGHPDFVKFLDLELIPYINEIFPVTDDPRLTLVCGSSFGGLTALFCGLTNPNRFGLILSQAASAAYSSEPQPIKGKILRAVEDHDKLPGRYYLDIGKREMYLCPNCDRPATIAHRELVDLIKQRCETVYSLEYQGSHDYACWRYSLPIGLECLFNKVTKF